MKLTPKRDHAEGKYDFVISIRTKVGGVIEYGTTESLPESDPRVKEVLRALKRCLRHKGPSRFDGASKG